MTKTPPERQTPLPPCSAVLAALLPACRWTGGRLAEAAGLAGDTVSRYVTGKVQFEVEQLIELAAFLGVGPETVRVLVRIAKRFSRPASVPSHPLAPGPAEQQELLAQAVRLVLGFEPLVYGALCQEWSQKKAADDRERARSLIAELEPLDQDERQRRVSQEPEYRLWALTPELGERSIRSIGASVTEAAEWTALARLAAEAADVPEGWRPALRACALFFTANVERVANRLDESELVYRRAWETLREGNAQGLPLGEWRYLRLEASLRCDQQRGSEAVAALRRAIPLAPKEAVPQLQVDLAGFLNEMGEAGSAFDALIEVQSQVEASGSRRLRCGLAFHLATSLSQLGRPGEAAPHAVKALNLALAAGWRLDELRCRWLVGRVDRELGFGGAARLTFAEVRQGFAALDLALDAALAGLDEALLLLEQGAHGEVRALAGELVWIFRSNQLAEKMLAALRVFCDAARREQASVALALRTQCVLRGARTLAGSPEPP